jgi:hypothetical protein
MDTDELGMEGPSEVPNTSTNKINKGKGVEKQQTHQYDPRERLPSFLINTGLGDILLPAIIRGYQNDTMAQNGVRKPFKWHREQYIVLDDPSITENLRLHILEGRITDDDSAPTLRTIIIRSSHQSVGHQGADKSYIQCQKCFYWPNMKKDFDQYVQECMLCLRNKDCTGKPIGDTKILKIPLRPWESIAIDFLGPFNVSNGYQHITVVMDRFSSAIILVPLRNKFTARDVANAFLTEIYSTHGLLSSILGCVWAPTWTTIRCARSWLQRELDFVDSVTVWLHHNVVPRAMVPAGPDDSKQVESTSARTTIQPPPQAPATTTTRNKHPQPQPRAFFPPYPSDVVAGGRAGGDSGGRCGW